MPKSRTYRKLNLGNTFCLGLLEEAFPGSKISVTGPCFLSLILLFALLLLLALVLSFPSSTPALPPPATHSSPGPHGQNVWKRLALEVGSFYSTQSSEWERWWWWWVVGGASSFVVIEKPLKCFKVVLGNEPFCLGMEQTLKKNGSPRGIRKQIEETSRGNWISQGFGVAHYWSFEYWSMDLWMQVCALECYAHSEVCQNVAVAINSWRTFYQV